MGVQQLGPAVVETAADSPEELALLATIIDHPVEELPRLVYADWLEERGDPRGAFLREFVLLARDPAAPLPNGEEFAYSWRQVTGVWHRHTIRRLIAEGGIDGPHADRAEHELLRAARPTIHMLPVPTADEDLPSGCSKFGGRPDLATGTEWPVNPPREGLYSTAVFVAQLRLSDFQGTLVGRQVPSRGLVSFFHNPGVAGPVLSQSDDAAFKRPDAPDDPQWDRAGWHFGRSFHPLPSTSLRMIEGLDLPLTSELGAMPEEFFHGNWDYINDDLLFGARPPQFGYHIPHHQFLGYGLPANAFPPPEQKPGVRRLATFGSDTDSLTYWGDSGQPFWFISEDDLAAGRFERAGRYVG